MASARSWYHSPEYKQFKSIRLGATTGRAVLVQGID
ncbi:DUF1330 domain-containing protein [Aggregatibacter sp. 2125159857]|nr:DUF1330 domain-containing protein [Aggregatibacter sp. 2125159857]QTO00821.1 DUF1330 domain-containing protein [Aggregatibacter sp. 2125159857]